MTPNQTKLIRETWDKVVPIADTAAQMFYQRLFEIDPSTRPLFDKTDMGQQRGKLLKALSLVVENADQVERLTPVFEEMGRRHKRYGVEDWHYDSVGAALIWTLKQGLGTAFTESVRIAWISVYAIVSEPMRRAACEVPKAMPKRASFSHAAAAVCLTLGLAGGMAAVSLPVVTSQAQAFGLSDITGAAKKAGGAAKKVGSAAKKGAKVVGKGAESVGKVGIKAAKVPVGVGQAARNTALSTIGKVSVKPALLLVEGSLRIEGKWDERKKEELREVERQYTDWWDDLGDKMDRVPGKAGQGVNDLISNRGGITSGESLKPLPKKPSRLEQRRLENGLVNHARDGGLNRTVKKSIVKGNDATRNPSAYTGPAGTMKLGLAKGGAFYKGPQGITRKDIARDRSILGRPVGKLKTGMVRDKMFRGGSLANNQKPIGRGNEVVPIKRGGRGNEVVRIRKGSNAPVRGISRENLKPGKGRKVKTTVVRDKSVLGRPIGVKIKTKKSTPKIKRIIRDHRPVRNAKPVVRNNPIKRRSPNVTVRDRSNGVKRTRIIRNGTSSSRRATVRSGGMQQDRSVQKPSRNNMKPRRNGFGSNRKNKS